MHGFIIKQGSHNLVEKKKKSLWKRILIVEFNLCVGEFDKSILSIKGNIKTNILL